MIDVQFSSFYIDPLFFIPSALSTVFVDITSYEIVQFHFVMLIVSSTSFSVDLCRFFVHFCNSQ